MRFRLSKLGPRARLLALGLGTLALIAQGACSGQKFTANGTPSAGASSEAGAGGDTTSEAGESGSPPDAGGPEGGGPEGGSSGAPAGGRAGMAGNAGSASLGCDCVAGQYCQDGSGNCRNCTDFRRFEFGRAQKVSGLSSSASERFARTAGTGSALFYVSGAADKAKIMYAAAPVSGVGSPVSGAGRVESGALFVSGFAEQNLFFDRLETGGRKLLMALWTAPILTKEAPIPGLINAAGFEDYSIAISPNTGHVYWMSNRNGEAELLWQPTSMSAPPAPAVVELKVKAGATECARSGEDATPWVNVAGTLLLFRNPSLNDSCEPIDSGATDLFAAPLNAQGIPSGAAVPLASLNNTGGTSWETDPSLSPDSCTIYFASDYDNPSGDFDLYKAQRN